MRGRNIDSLYNGIFLERHASGLLLSSLCGKLAVLSDARSDITLRSPEQQANKVTRIELIRKDESLRRSNIAALRKSKLTITEVFSKLAEKVPSLTEERPVVADELDIHANSKGEHYLSLVFTTEDNDKNGDERTEAWRVLEDITQQKLDWGYSDPSMRVMYAGETVAKRAVEAIGDIFMGTLRGPEPFGITLLPALDPEHYPR